MGVRAQSFPPILPRQARVLILGSLPGVASLRANEYYAHPRNAFWPVMGSLLHFDAALPYAARVEALRSRQIAVWDVCRSARRAGSLDAAIEARSARPNDIAGLLAAQRGIVAVYCNGRAAEQLYRRWIVPGLAAMNPAPDIRAMPSTSPAMASLSLRQKILRWSRILEDLR